MNHRPLASLKHLKSFQTIDRLEKRYSLISSRITSSFETTFQSHFELADAHRSLKTFIESLTTHSPFPGSAEIDDLFKKYLAEITSIHDTTALWTGTYLGLIWPDEILSKKIRRRANAKTKAEWQRRVQTNLDTLAKQTSFPSSRNDQRLRIMELARLSQTLDRDSLAWLKNHRQLVDAVYDEMILTVNENRQRINSCFKKTAYAFTFPRHDDPRRVFIYDWINGYKQPGPNEVSAESKADATIAQGLKICERRRLLRLGLRNTAIALVLFGVYSCAHFYKLDVNVYSFLKTQTLRLIGRDPASLNLKEKKDYFYKFILEINDQVKPEELARSLQDFNDQRLYQQPSGMYVFAEEIVSKYFLLLSAQKASLELTSDVLDTAGLMDNNIQRILEQIANMFDSKLIEDSKLRGLLLELRRGFVRHNVFPFTFIVIKNNTPYLFMYPEKIQQRYRFTAMQFEYIGFNSSYYSQFVRFPLRVFVVKGDRYPFKDRSGYFEGEFAIVFSDLAARVEWSAWHEFAHIIDHMRLNYGRRMLPRNIEINAMLFPAMFAEDPHSYFTQRLFPIVGTTNTEDAYVQASKAILNGYLLLNAQKTGAAPVEISDKFEMENLIAARDLILAMGNDAIRQAALEIYKKPDVYLKTAKAGEYSGVVSNAEEIIAGTPRAPYGGFILGSGYSSSGDDQTGIKFVFDNQNSDLGFFQGKNILGIIQEIFLFMVHAHSSDTKGFTLINVIAAVVDFILIIGFFLGVHWWGSPLRKRKFYGPDFRKWFDTVYTNNPLSDGRSSGDQPGEKQLLAQVLLSKGNISDDLRRKIKTLKASMSLQQAAILDILLTLAPFNPQISMVRSKWHDFMFWFPYFGPTLARNAWLFPRQRAFNQWEAFNEQLFALARSISRTTAQDVWHARYKEILKNFKNPERLVTDTAFGKTMTGLQNIEQGILTHLNDLSPTTDIKAPTRTHRLPWLGNQDGEFDHLAAYTWQDDVKRIDWKATARSANREPKVKRYSGSAGAQLEFLMDFRTMHQTHAQEKIARDFIQSLHILKNDHELKSITLIMPGGELRQRSVNIKGNVNRTELCRRIWPLITREFEEHQREVQALKASDLTFYTAQENMLYRRITELTDIADTESQMRDLTQIPLRGLNVYLIGAEDKEREELTKLLPRTQQPFYWK